MHQKQPPANVALARPGLSGAAAAGRSDPESEPARTVTAIRAARMARVFFIWGSPCVPSLYATGGPGRFIPPPRPRSGPESPELIAGGAIVGAEEDPGAGLMGLLIVAPAVTMCPP